MTDYPNPDAPLRELSSRIRCQDKRYT